MKLNPASIADRLRKVVQHAHEALDHVSSEDAAAIGPGGKLIVAIHNAIDDLVKVREEVSAAHKAQQAP